MNQPTGFNGYNYIIHTYEINPQKQKTAKIKKYLKPLDMVLFSRTRTLCAHVGRHTGSSDAYDGYRKIGVQHNPLLQFPERRTCFYEVLHDRRIQDLEPLYHARVPQSQPSKPQASKNSSERKPSSCPLPTLSSETDGWELTTLCAGLGSEWCRGLWH